MSKAFSRSPTQSFRTENLWACTRISWLFSILSLCVIVMFSSFISQHSYVSENLIQFVRMHSLCYCINSEQKYVDAMNQENKIEECRPFSVLFWFFSLILFAVILDFLLSCLMCVIEGRTRSSWRDIFECIESANATEFNFSFENHFLSNKWMNRICTSSSYSFVGCPVFIWSKNSFKKTCYHWSINQRKRKIVPFI